MNQRGLVITDLMRYASGFPSMGGTLNGPLLRELAANVPDGMAIVELGTWLGAGTAQLALGLAGRAGAPVIHSYDQFRVGAGDFAWAGRRGLALELGQDTRAMVGASLVPFGQDVRLHAGNLIEQSWSGGPIGLFVDDMTKWPVPFHHALVTFGPSWVPGVTTIVLMDYLYWRKAKPSHQRALQVQASFMEANSEYFEPMRYDYETGSTTRAFLYTQAFDFGLLPPFDVRGPVAKLLPPAFTGAIRRLLQTGRG